MKKSCNRIKALNKGNIKHGEYGTPIYKKWVSMRIRVKCHPHYLSHNIVCCKEWDNYINFKKWAEDNGFDNKLSLDRIDTYGNYEPANCRWVDKTMQASNIRIKSNNKSGYSGVSFNKKKQKYIVQIQYNGRKTYIGQYKEAVDGALAFDKFVIDNNLPHTLNFGGHYANK